jgi:hypothetical protein
MKLNHIFSFIIFAIGALCFVVLVTTLKPQLHDPIATGRARISGRHPAGSRLGQGPESISGGARPLW